MSIRSVSIAAVGLIAITSIVGCSGDDQVTKASTTTISATTTTVDPKKFAAAMKEMTSTLAGADGSICEIFKAISLTGNAGLPSTTAQTKVAYEFLRDALKAVADLAPKSSEADAKVISEAADAMFTEATESKFDPLVFSAEGGPKALSEERFQTAFKNFQQSAQKTCSTAGAASSTTAP